MFFYAGAASRLSGSQNAASSFALINIRSGSYAAINANPKDIVTDGASFWVVDDDSKSDKVFKYTVDGGYLGNWSIDPANKAPTAIAIDPANVSNIWIVDSGTDRVYEYVGAASRTFGGQAATLSWALATGNGNPQGIADPPIAVRPAAVSDATITPIANVLAADPDAFRFAARPAQRQPTASASSGVPDSGDLRPTAVADIDGLARELVFATFRPDRECAGSRRGLRSVRDLRAEQLAASVVAVPFRELSIT